MRERVESVAQELRGGGLRIERGHAPLVQTRREVESGWLAFAEMLALGGMREASDRVRRFVERMPSAQTDREEIASQLQSRIHNAPTRTLQR